MKRPTTRRGEAKPRSNRVVICGSMSAYGAMEACAEALRSAGVDVVLPAPDKCDLRVSYEECRSLKRRASRIHISQVMHPRTAAVLVVNVDKDGKFDYVGPNAFAEIAVAFAHKKFVFLLQDVPDAYRDELEAWDVLPLCRRLDQLVQFIRPLTFGADRDESSQLRLFNDAPAP